MSGWNPQSCRACTTTDVKFFHLHDAGLAELFALITGASVLPADGLPEFLCYYCCAQLLRFNEFRLKCHKSLTFFQDTGQVVSSYNKIISKKYCIPLSRTENLVLHYTPKDNVEYESDDIKTDNLNSDDVINSDIDDWKEDDEKSNQQFEVKNEICIEEVDIKNEIAGDNITAEPSFNTNTDKDTLNSKKAPKVSKPKTQKTKRKTEASDENKPKQKRVTKPKKKKCNRYNEKFEEDFEEFSKKYEVKVICLSKEEQLRKVQERKESDAYKQSRLSCDICYKWFMSESAHAKHMKGHNPSSGTFVCEICQLRYSSRFTFNNHVRRHRKRFICSICGQHNSCMTRAKLHSEWHRGLKFKCKVCEKEFNANSTYLNHKRELHKAVSCADCGESFRGTNELLRHTDVEHGNMKYKCGICTVLFQSAEALVLHSSNQACHGKNYPCRHCGTNFPYKTDLQAHIAERHPDSAEKFTCTLCGAIFSSDKNRSVHFNYNHGKTNGKQKQYKANLRQSKYAKAHPKKNKNDDSDQEDFPSYLCDVCAKSFKCPTKLKTHLQIHTGEKPFICPMCPKAFRCKKTREIHINTHTGERPYKCRLCPEMFKSYAQRYKHKLLVHTGERRHKCTMCEKTYVVAYDLKEHVKYVHLNHPRPPRKNPRNYKAKSERKIDSNGA